MTIEQFLLKAIRKIYRTASNMPEVFHRKANNGQGYQYYGYVELYDQEANDYVREALETGSPCMVSKFGTIELYALSNYKFYIECELYNLALSIGLVLLDKEPINEIFKRKKF